MGWSVAGDLYHEHARLFPAGAGLLTLSIGTIAFGNGFLHHQYNPGTTFRTVAGLGPALGCLGIVVSNRVLLRRGRPLMLIDTVPFYYNLLLAFLVLPVIYKGQPKVLDFLVWLPLIGWGAWCLYTRHPLLASSGAGTGPRQPMRPADTIPAGLARDAGHGRGRPDGRRFAHKCLIHLYPEEIMGQGRRRTSRSSRDSEHPHESTGQWSGSQQTLLHAQCRQDGRHASRVAIGGPPGGAVRGCFAHGRNRTAD